MIEIYKYLTLIFHTVIFHFKTQSRFKYPAQLIIKGCFLSKNNQVKLDLELSERTDVRPLCSVKAAVGRYLDDDEDIRVLSAVQL